MKVKVKNTEYDIEERDVALIEAIKELSNEIGRLVDNGR